MNKDDLEEEIYQLEIRQSRAREAANDASDLAKAMTELVRELQVELLDKEIQAGRTTLVEALIDPYQGTRDAAQVLMRKKNGHL